MVQAFEINKKEVKIMVKTKLSLEEFKVQSFITKLDQNHRSIIAGANDTWPMGHCASRISDDECCSGGSSGGGVSGAACEPPPNTWDECDLP